MNYSSQSRRSSRHRRRRHLRRKLAALVLITFGLLSLFVVTHRHYFGLFSSSSLESSRRSGTSDLADLVSRLVASSTPKNHPVYAYSIIPGGVQDASELRTAVERDAVVAQHYAGFDYSRAQITEVREPKLVYLSYRMKDKVYWTRKPHALHKGEKLISDGKITARARCGNQVSEQPKAEVSPVEPPEVVFEQPLGDGGTGFEAPDNYASLLKGNELGPPGPPPIGGAYAPGVGGGVPPFAAPPLPISNGCPQPTKARSSVSSGPWPEETSDQKNQKNPCLPQPPPSPVPEPATIALVSAGIAAAYWKYRKVKSA